MYLIFILITFFACYKIFINKGVQRGVWFIGSILILSDDIRIWGPFNSHFLFVISFILSLINKGEFKYSYKIYPLSNISIIILILDLMIGVLDQRISLISRISRPISEFSLTYMAFFIGFCFIKSFNDLNLIIRNLVKILFIVCSFGVITFIIQNNPWYDLLTSCFRNDVGIWSNVQSRGYRTCSFLSNPIVYGGVMGMYSIIVLNVWNTRKRFMKYTIFILLLLSVAIANSRTGMFTTLVCYIIFYLLKNKLSYKNFILLLTAIVIFVFTYYNVDFIKPMIDSAIDLVVTGGENTGGSNVDLKEQQWIASLTYFYNAPFFGNGIAYFDEVIGNVNSPLQNTLLAGMEGYQYKLLIENGLFMIVTVIIFYAKLFILFFKNSESSIAYVGIACTFTFLFFICATGTYGSTFLHFGIYIGLFLRCVYDKNILNPYPCIQRGTFH